MRRAFPLMLLLTASVAVMAAPTPKEPAAEPAQQVAVAGSKDPDWKPYRKMLDGPDAFSRYHSLAPKAELKFILRPQQPNLALADLQLRIVGDNVSIDVPIADDATFSVPRDEAAARDDADFRLNSKKGLFRWRPDIHTPRLPAGAPAWRSAAGMRGALGSRQV
jgi:hypothetical protein